MIDLLRRNRDFRLLYIAQVINYGGDWFATVALLGIVLDLSHNSGLAVSMVWVAQFLPGFLVTPFSGPAADRFDRKKIMTVVCVAQTVAALGFLLIAHTGLWIAYVAQATISGLGAFFGPASQAALPNVVDGEDFATATAAMSSTWGTMLAIGAGLGAAFTALFGRNAAFVADAASFAASALLIAKVRRSTRAAAAARKGRMRPVEDTVEALQYARSKPAVFALLFSKAGFGVGGGIVGMLAVISKTRFHAGDGGTGVFLAARGLGVLAGPWFARRYLRADRPVTLVRACAIGSFVYGVGYVFVSASPALLLAAAFVLAAHLGGGAQWTFSAYGLQSLSADEYRGRVMAADFALVTLTMSLSLLGAGLLESHIGAEWTIAAIAAFNILWGAIYLGIAHRLQAAVTGERASSTMV